MKRLLVVAAENPFPPDSGGRLRIFNLLSILVSQHQVDLLTLERDNGAEPLQGIRTIKIKRTVDSRRAALRSIYMRRNCSWISHVDLDLAAPLKGLLAERDYEIVILESTMLGALIPIVRRFNPGCHLVVDAHNFETALCRQIANSQSSLFRRAFFSLNAYLTRNDEIKVLKRASVLMTCSEDDAAQFRGLQAAESTRIVVVSNFLNLKEYELSALRTSERNRILFHGDMEYWPNVNAALFFYRNVFPLIRERRPDTKWSIVGKNTHPLILDAVKDDKSVSVVGWVARMADHIEQCDVVVVPLREGSGTRFKILEAWAIGRPVVSTTIGAEGLGCIDGREILIADTPEKFAEATLRLLADSAIAEGLVRNAHAAYVGRFHSDAVAKALSQSLTKQ